MGSDKITMGVLACVVLALGLAQSVQGAPTEEEKQLRDEFFAELKKSEDIGMKKEALIRGYAGLGKKIKRVVEEHHNAAKVRDGIINKKGALTRAEMEEVSSTNDLLESMSNLHNFLESTQKLLVKKYGVLSKMEDVEASLRKGTISKAEYNQEKQTLLGEARHIDQQVQERELAHTLTEVILNLNRPLWEEAHKTSIQCNMN
jgi:hypothetical protein